ncbi:MAG TPA: hypothetical protein VFL59_07310, partial [Candidatus Nanopelagicales bacterium]|nr:hypothetical protein [Candidatus Nanopelagicales bacterium]
MNARTIGGALTSLVLAAVVLVAPETAHATVTRTESPAQAAAALNAVAAATHDAAGRGYALRTQQGMRTWNQLYDPQRRTLLTSTDDGRIVIDTPDAEFTPLDRAATTRTIVAGVGKSRASWSYTYDPGNALYTPALSGWLSDRFVADGTVTADRGATVIDSATLTTRPDGVRVWSIQMHGPSPAASTTRMTVASDARDRLLWQSIGSQRLSLTVSYDAPTVVRPTKPEVIWTTLLARAREAYAVRIGVDPGSLAAAARPLPRAPMLSDLGGALPLSTPAVTTSTAKIHWAATTLGVSLRDVDLRTHQGDRLVEL